MVISFSAVWLIQTEIVVSCSELNAIKDTNEFTHTDSSDVIGMVVN